MNLPNPLKYQNLYFEIVEVDRDFLNGIVSGGKVSYIDYSAGIIYIDGFLDDRVKLRCLVMDILDLCCREIEKPMNNVDLVVLTGVVIDLLESFKLVQDKGCKGCKDVKYIE